MTKLRKREFFLKVTARKERGTRRTRRYVECRVTQCNTEIVDNSPCELDSVGCPQGEANRPSQKSRFSYPISVSAASVVSISSLVPMEMRRP